MRCASKALLFATYFFAVSLLSTSEVKATAVNATTTGVWSSSGFAIDDGSLAEAFAGEALGISGNGVTVTITNDGTADDTGGGAILDVFTLGAVTDTSAANDGALTVISARTPPVSPFLTVGMTSINVDGNVSVSNRDIDNTGAVVTSAGAITIGRTLVVTNNESSAATVVSLATTSGALAVLGTATVTGGGVTNANASLNVAGGNAVFTSGLTLDDGAGGGTASVTFTDTAARTVTGTVNGGAAGEGNITIGNSGGTTFSNIIGGTNSVGTVLISGSANSAATFSQNVSATNITLGDGAGTETNTATFSTAGGNRTITGLVNGDGTGNDTSNVVISGGNTLNAASIWGGTNALDAVTITGAGTGLTTTAAFAATTLNVAANSLLTAGADVTADVNLTGAASSAILGDGVSVTGAIDNTSGGANGTLVSNDLAGGSNSVVSGNVGATNALTSITLNTAGTLQFDGTVAATAVNSNAAAGTVIFNGDVTGQFDFANNASTVTFGDTADLTGAVNSTGGVNGTINFLGTSTVSGGLGLTAGTGFTALNINGAGKTVTITGNSFGANAVTAANSRLTLNGDMTLTGAMTNNGTVGVLAGRTLTSPSFAGTGTFDIEVVDSNANGSLDTGDVGVLASAGSIDLGAETISLNFSGTTPVGTIAIATGGAAATGPTSVTETSLLFDATVAVNGNNLDLTVTQLATSSLATTTNGAAVGTALDSVPSGDTQMDAFKTLIANVSSKEGAEQLFESVRPLENGAITDVVGQVTSRISAIIQNRMFKPTTITTAAATLSNPPEGKIGDVSQAVLTNTDESMRSPSSSQLIQTGVSTGDTPSRFKAWGQFFGTTTKQGLREGVEGADSNTYGAVIGADSQEIINNMTVGAAFSFSDSDSNSKGENRTNSHVNAFNLSLYGSYQLNEKTSLSGTLGYGHNDVNSVRSNVGLVSGQTAEADYNASQISMSINVARQYEYKGATLTPTVSVSGAHYNPETYTETGTAGGLNLTVDGESANIFALGTGISAGWSYESADGSKLVPSLSLGYSYDLIGDQITTVSSFSAGGPVFSTEGTKPAQGTFNAGLRLNYVRADSWEFLLGYNFGAKDEFTSHSGQVKATYKF